jgi:hypothetical protein
LAAHGPARFLAGQEAGIGEYPDVLQNVGERHREWLCQFADAQARHFRQSQQDRASRWIGERGEGSIELGGLKANHVVNYYGTPPRVNRKSIDVCAGSRMESGEEPEE